MLLNVPLSRDRGFASADSSRSTLSTIASIAVNLSARALVLAAVTQLLSTQKIPLCVRLNALYHLFLITPPYVRLCTRCTSTRVFHLVYIKCVIDLKAVLMKQEIKKTQQIHQKVHTPDWFFFAMIQLLRFRWRKRSILIESSSWPCFIKSWTKSKSLCTKVRNARVFQRDLKMPSPHLSYSHTSNANLCYRRHWQY